MDWMNEAARRYCREVNKLLPWKRDVKEKLMDELAENVATYLRDSPQATYSDIVQRMGTPEAIALSYLEMMEPTEVLRELNLKNRMVKIAKVAIAGILLLWGLSYLHSCEITYRSPNGWYEFHLYR